MGSHSGTAPRFPRRDAVVATHAHRRCPSWSWPAAKPRRHRAAAPLHASSDIHSARRCWLGVPGVVRSVFDGVCFGDEATTIAATATFPHLLARHGAQATPASVRAAGSQAGPGLAVVAQSAPAASMLELPLRRTSSWVRLLSSPCRRTGPDTSVVRTWTALKSAAPELLPFMRLFYGRPSTYCWWDESGQCRDIAQGEGCEQGDPLAPALLALGQHAALCQDSSTPCFRATPGVPR